MKRLVHRLLEDDHNEDGAIMVIASLVMVILLGFAAFAIDTSSWRAAQKEYQNAADAAALMAASKRYKTGVSQEEATKFAFQAASLNGLNLTDDEMTVTYDENNRKVTVIIRKPTDNYFATTITGQNETMISAESSAGLDVITTNNDAPFGVNAALESLGNLDWKGTPGCVVDGGVVTGGNLTITSGVTFNNGDVSGDGYVEIKSDPGEVLHATGNVFSGGNMVLTTPGGVIDGNVECNGDFNVKSQYTFGKSILSNGALSIVSGTVNGDMRSKGKLTISSENLLLKGSAQSNTQVVIGGNVPTIEGTLYQNGPIADWQIQQFAKTPVTIEPDDSIDDFAGIQHGNYKWHWEDLESYLAYDSNKSDANQPYTVADQDMFYNYLKDEYDASPSENWKAKIGYWDGTYDFWTGSDINKFLSYCRTHGKGEDYPVYFPGSLTLDEGTPVALNGSIVVQKDFKMNTLTAMTSSDASNIAVVSLNGNITIGNSGTTNTINGAVIDLSSGGNIQMNGGGTISGGVISKGTVVMNGKWDVTANTDWESSVQPVSSSNKILVRLKK